MCAHQVDMSCGPHFSCLLQGPLPVLCPRVLVLLKGLGMRGEAVDHHVNYCPSLPSAELGVKAGL